MSHNVPPYEVSPNGTSPGLTSRAPPIARRSSHRPNEPRPEDGPALRADSACRTGRPSACWSLHFPDDAFDALPPILFVHNRLFSLTLRISALPKPVQHPPRGPKTLHPRPRRRTRRQIHLIYRLALVPVDILIPTHATPRPPDVASTVIPQHSVLSIASR